MRTALIAILLLAGAASAQHDDIYSHLTTQEDVREMQEAVLERQIIALRAQVRDMKKEMDEIREWRDKPCEITLVGFSRVASLRNCEINNQGPFEER